MAEPGLRILLVEDEMLVAMYVEDLLIELGHQATAVAARLDPALALAAAAEVDAAILDINLAGERSFAIADLLAARGIPFVFATGYGEHGLEERFRGSIVLQKPFRCADLGQALAAVVGADRGGSGK